MSRRLNKPDTQADLIIRECLNRKTSFVVVAGAGSGKTTSLIKALTYIDEREGKALRQQAKRIACITYTTTAEMEILDDVGNNNLFYVSTIHSFLWDLIKPFQSTIKNWLTQKICTKIQELLEEQKGFSDRRVRETTRQKNLDESLRYEKIADQILTVQTFRYESGSNYGEGILGHHDIITMVPSLLKSNLLLQTILTKKYPYLFVDESQDTNQEFVEAMKIVDANHPQFCLGFFGDPMQKIYMSGAGQITLNKGWKLINKPENFRCATEVLTVINSIRSGADDLKQIGGRHEKVQEEILPVKGSAHLFIVNADHNRLEKINKVRFFLAQAVNDPFWKSDIKEADVRVLVIEHRMAAKRLKFGDLFEAFHDNSTESIKSGFNEGNLWALHPFIKFIIPLINSLHKKNHFAVIELLRKYCPLLLKNHLQTVVAPPRDLLASLQEHVVYIANQIKSETVTVGELLAYIHQHKIMQLDDRLTQRLLDQPYTGLEKGSQTVDFVIKRYFAVPANQLLGYQKYIDNESPYSTQHSIKGSEFERVLVILDDEEGKLNSYSYEKLLGIANPSETDRDNIAEGKDNTLARTRRLFYVCCSRALKDLAVLIFVSDVEKAINLVINSGIFNRSSIITEGELGDFKALD